MSWIPWRKPKSGPEVFKPGKLAEVSDAELMRVLIGLRYEDPEGSSEVWQDGHGEIVEFRWISDRSAWQMKTTSTTFETMSLEWFISASRYLTER